ncbi:hypothetical protein [Nonomuraea typhae]|uniref:hypothetical protein n=1 Tax=Nonomuraea typhae TaxID=2603600 RepID=UPI0015E1CC32|nr:hypothetical protein [Nonomuraea typhae]
MGPDNAFTLYGIDLEEYTAALIDALRVGGASRAEITEAALGCTLVGPARRRR